MGDVFEGVRVLDCSSWVAGAFATMLLGDHGASVVKVEPPAGDPYRARPGFQALGRGKRSVVLDLRFETGQGGLARLARGADVLLFDGTTATARARGIDAEAWRAANPALLTVGLPPYGERGPDAEAAGSAELVAAAGGLLAAQAAATGEPVSL
ncbi:MAG: CoA transferase, partial [Chloroflexi bacterium]|nr:CoA transferase [Chloroflexota bacterium]